MEIVTFLNLRVYLCTPMTYWMQSCVYIVVQCTNMIASKCSWNVLGFTWNIIEVHPKNGQICFYCSPDSLIIQNYTTLFSFTFETDSLVCLKKGIIVVCYHLIQKWKFRVMSIASFSVSKIYTNFKSESD